MAEAGTLREAFVDELCDAYDAEKQLTEALAQLSRAASSPELREAFQTHLEETQGHTDRLELVFATLDEKVRARQCDGIAVVIEEGRSIMEANLDDITMDACLIAAGQRAEHYEIAAYERLVAWAQAMDYADAASLLRQTLDEEKAAEQRLSSLAGDGLSQRTADTAHPDRDEPPVVTGAATHSYNPATLKLQRL
jgi:ferritin-like metal-binding protein YciE